MKKLGLLDQIPKEVWAKAWNVNCQAVGDGRKSLRYLAPYVFRVAIGNYRIVDVYQDDRGKWFVRFLVRPSRATEYQAMELEAEGFLHRFLQHVLPRGFQKVRHFGFMHKRSKWKPRWLSMLVTVSLSLVYVLTVRLEPKVTRKKPCCPVCGGELAFVGIESPMERTPKLDDTS
jgi:hypothetical protein